MLRKFKKIIHKILDSLGYSLSKKLYEEPIDLRALSNNPKSLHYLTKTNRQIIINTTFDKGRGLEIFPLSYSSYHPYIMAVRYAYNSGDYQMGLRKILSRYYSTVQPQNTAEWFGFKKGEIPLLDNEPAWLSLLPWENSSIDYKKHGRKECAIYDNKEHGSSIIIEEGWRSFGPVSADIIDIEVSRLYKLMISIEKNGILRDNGEGGDIGAIVLMKEPDDYRWIVEWGGQHRAAAISGMGYKNITIRVWQIVERKDVNLWPNVQSGVYTIKTALEIFDKIYNGTSLSGVTKNWEENE